MKTVFIKAFYHIGLLKNLYISGVLDIHVGLYINRVKSIFIPEGLASLSDRIYLDLLNILLPAETNRDAGCS